MSPPNWFEKVSPHGRESGIMSSWNEQGDSIEQEGEGAGRGVGGRALNIYTATGRSETKIKRGSGWASLSGGLFTISERTGASDFCRWPIRVA